MRGGARSRIVWAVAAVSALSLIAFASSAAPAPGGGSDHGASASANDWSAPQAGPHARPEGRIYGVIPSAAGVETNPQAAPDTNSHRPSWSDFARTSFASPAPLTYHGGPVMTTNKTYAIYWLPSGSTVSANYVSLINQFFGDVAAASQSHATDNVYATGTQYYQGSGTKTFIANDSSFADSWTDTTTPIPDHCSSRYAAKGLTVTGCVTDADIQAEIASVMTAKGWTPDPSKLFLLFTPRSVGSCITSGSNTCSYTYYCAYHSDFVGGSGDVLYANQPYPDLTGATGACDSGQKPNGDWADQTINLISHEHNEAITDPNGNAWYDSSGNENGDKCAWNFGTALGGLPGAQYNQLINSHKYYVQQEWSNASSSCALGYAPPAPPTIGDFNPKSGPTGTSVVITGASFTGATAVTFNGTASSYTVNSSTQITAKVPSGATDGPITVTTPSGPATSAASFDVTPTPDFGISALPPSQTVSRGGSTTYAVTVAGSNGFAGSVQLKVSGIPNRSSSSFNPSTVAGGSGSSTLTVTTSSRTSRGTFTLTITGTSGSLSHSTHVTLVVT